MTSTTSSGQVFVGLRADDRTMLRVPLSSVLFFCCTFTYCHRLPGNTTHRRRQKFIIIIIASFFEAMCRRVGVSERKTALGGLYAVYSARHIHLLSLAQLGLGNAL